MLDKDKDFYWLLKKHNMDLIKALSAISVQEEKVYHPEDIDFQKFKKCWISLLVEQTASCSLFG